MPEKRKLQVLSDGSCVCKDCGVVGRCDIVFELFHVNRGLKEEVRLLTNERDQMKEALDGNRHISALA